MAETYVSTDIEADGPIPGPHSMLSFGSVAYDEDGAELASFEATLDTLPGAVGDPKTMAFWERNPVAWQAARTNPRPPETVMPDYVAWLRALPGKPVFVGYPVTYDFMWVYWYLMRFVGESPFSHSGLDIKTMAMALLGRGYRDSTKRNMPSRWFVAPDGSSPDHRHEALADAREQGVLFCQQLAELKRLRAARTR